jgi:hypothetical protein
MSILRELRVEEDKLETALSTVRRKIQFYLDEKAKKLCPLKVGEIIERTATWGYRGKTRVQRVKITRIKGKDSRTGYTLEAVNIKKDGTEGTYIRYLYDWDWNIDAIVKERDGNKKAKDR